MKIYRYRLGIDTIIERIDRVTLIDDKYYIDEDEDYLTPLCRQSEVNTGRYVNNWEYAWLCYDTKQNKVDIKCDISRLMKEQLHYLKKSVVEFNSKIAAIETELEMMVDYEWEREYDC